MINIIYGLNYLVFAAFLTLFLMEVGIAILSLISYYEYEHKVRRYLHTMWEINGTFAIFYLVEFEASYPNLLPLIGTIYLAPALAAGLFVIIRNAFVAYSEFIGHKDIEKSYVRIYSVATLIIAFAGISILTSSLSGIGVSVPNSSIDLVQMFFNVFNIAMFVGIALLVYFLISAYFNEKQNFLPSLICGILGIALIVFALNSSVPYIVQNAISHPYLMLALLVLTLAIMLLYYVGNTYAKYVVFLSLFIDILAFGAFQYPYYFGGSLNVNSYLASGAISGYVIFITVVGGALLLAGLGYIFYLNHKNDDKDADPAGGY